MLGYADECGSRVHATASDDAFVVNWFGVFNTKGSICNRITGSWSLRCGHVGRRGQSHVWDPEACPAKGHTLLQGEVERSSVLLYGVEFTEQQRFTEVTKKAICRALDMCSGAVRARQLLPATWKASKTRQRKKSRTR